MTASHAFGSFLRGYGLAVATTGVAVLLILPLQSEGGFAAPLLIPVAVSALVGGIGPGLLSLVLATTAAHIWLFETEGAIRQLAFLGTGLPLVVLGGVARQGRMRAASEAAATHAREEQLQASDERYRAFLEQTEEAIWRYELEEPLDVTLPEDRQIEHLYTRGYLAECNDAAARSRGFRSARELVGARLHRYLPADAENLLYVRSFIHNGYRHLNAESHEVDQHGKMHYFLTNLIGIVENGMLLRVWGSQRDITERKQVDEALRLSEERYRALVDATAQVVWTWNPNTGTGDLLAAHQWWEHVTGQTSAEQMSDGGYGWITAVHPEDRERVRSAWDAMMQGLRFDIEYRLRSRDGNYRNVAMRMVPMYAPNGHVREYVGMSIDTTAQHRAENAVRASEARLRRVLEADVIGIAFWNGDRVTDANGVFLRMFGYDRADIEAGRLTYDVLTPPEYYVADQRGFAELMAKGSTGLYEKEQLRKDGSRVPVMVGATFIGGGSSEMVVFLLDLSERRRAEEQLQVAQRLETIGRLAGGIAHEANNQMSIILGSTYFILQRNDLVQEVRDDVEQIARAAEHTGAITRQLLAFSRRQVLQPQLLDLNQEIRDLEPVLQRTLGAQITLVSQLAPELGLVRADAGQLSQVLLNLVLNARDAMPQHGTVTIETANETFDAASKAAALGEPIFPGSYAVLSVRDTGYGMDAETLSRVFEPFFTTKPVGEGTGLGLSTVHGIVRQSNGYIAVESVPNQGTTFRILLPLSEAEPKPPSHSEALFRILHRRATILLVDDQAAVRGPLARALRAEGYSVLEAGNAKEALAAATEDGMHVDLLVTDVVMPEMSGGELAKKLTALRPGMRVLFTSGHADEEVRRRGLLDLNWPFLQKPYSPEVLTTRVRELLERRRWPRF